MSARAGGRVLLASNRGPLSFTLADDGSLSARRGGGGLVSGLSAVAGDADVLWVCAALDDAGRAAADGAAGGRLDLDGTPNGSGIVRMLEIPADVFGAAYNAVANSTLWFIHHLLYDTPNQPSFEAGFQTDWAAFRAYNAAFAEALAADAGPADAAPVRALVQDYHLCLVPRMLADLRPDVRIAHFTHTPWAPPEYYRMLPGQMGREILAGMLGADHAGFHSQRWADAFLDCCAEILGAAVDRAAQQVSYNGHVTGVGVHPLGVAAEELTARAAEPDVQDRITDLAEATAGTRLIVRVDRTELSKNIARGLAAYRELLITHPEWRGRLTHVAFAYPSRTDLPEYRAYTENVQQLAREINEEFATEGWQPLMLEVFDDYARSLAAYRLADVLLVNPIRDGMNLVAKEGPILSDRACALVLSTEAGAADELGSEALLVNPFDVTATANALHEALIMTDPERIPPECCPSEGRRRHAAAAMVRPAARRPRALAGAARGQCRPGCRAANAAASELSRATTPSGPSTIRSASAASVVTSAEPLHTARPGIPAARSELTARKAGTSPRSSPQNAMAPGARSAARLSSAAPLSAPGGRSSSTNRPGSSTRPCRSARSASGPRRCSSASAGWPAFRVCTATASPLRSVRVPSGAPAAASTPGRSRLAAATPGEAGGAVSVPASQRSRP